MATKLDNPDADGNGEVHLYLARILRRILINFLSFFFFFLIFLADTYTCPILGPLIPLFWKKIPIFW